MKSQGAEAASGGRPPQHSASATEKGSARTDISPSPLRSPGSEEEFGCPFLIFTPLIGQNRASWNPNADWSFAKAVAACAIQGMHLCILVQAPAKTDKVGPDPARSRPRAVCEATCLCRAAVLNAVSKASSEKETAIRSRRPGLVVSLHSLSF